jgi:hypothetical protein
MPRSAPFSSKSQARLAMAAAAHPGGAGGMPQAVGKKLVAEMHAGHQKLGSLPTRVAKKAEGGRVRTPPRFRW